MPKSSIADVDAEVLDRAQRVQRVLARAHQRDFGQLEAEVGRIDAARRPAPARPCAGKSGSSSWRVETLTVTVSGCQARGVPAGEVAQRGAQHLRAERRDQARLLGQRDELGRRGLVPARQRLDADDPARARGRSAAGSGRPARSSSAARSRCSSSSMRTQPAPRVSSVKTSTRSLPAPLAWYIAESASRSSASASNRSSATWQPMLTRTCRRWPPISNGAAIALADAAGDRQRALGVGDVLQQDGELVAAEARDHVASRTACVSRSATSISSRSPDSWPKPSLTTLKSSRSRNSTATVRRSRRPATGDAGTRLGPAGR